MGRFADDSVYSNAPSPTTGAGLAILASNQRAILELPGAQAPQLVTIADGAITPTGAFLRVDTEGQAAADDLTIINVAINDTESLHDGMIVYLQAADSGRVVTIKNTASAGGITTYDGQDVVLDTTSWLVLQLRQGTWYEMRNLFDKTLKDVADSKTTAAEAAHAAMPSGQYIDLPVPANLGNVTAPADGWLYYLRTASVANAYIRLDNSNGMSLMTDTVVNFGLSLLMPVKKDDIITISSNSTDAAPVFRFYYANGSATTV